MKVVVALLMFRSPIVRKLQYLRWAHREMSVFWEEAWSGENRAWKVYVL